MDYKNNSNTGLIIVADCMLLSVEYIGNVHLFFNILLLVVSETQSHNQNKHTYTWGSSKSSGLAPVGAVG